MINLILILRCCMFCMLFANVITRDVVSNSVNVQSFFNDGTIFVEGHSVNSSYIKSLTADSTISKIYVYVADTFFVDEDLLLQGIAELQIFANTWNITRPATFDLSGLNGASPEAAIVKGSAGKSGTEGVDGGNFFGLANDVINGDSLTVISNGGNGGDGQDGTASDDIYVLYGGDNDVGDSGWFNQVDLRNYYEKYFNDKGYDVDISDIDDYTSLYAVFVHNKKASFNIRLHPRKCCGTTGMGGAGGLGGRTGTFVFKHVGDSYLNHLPVSTPKFIENDGSKGKSGKDAKTCETLALDVRADAELKKIVFFFPPLHQSFSSQFTVLDHINCSKCAPEYVKSTQTVVSHSKPSKIETTSAVFPYKRFLLENMKNKSLTNVTLKAYQTIDKSHQINDEYSLEALMLEAFELEKNSAELKKSIDLVPLYQRLSNRIEHSKLKIRNKDEGNLKSKLVALLWFKLNDLKRNYGHIVNLTSIAEVYISQIELRSERSDTKLDIGDVELLNKFNQIKFGVNGNYFLDMYKHVIDGFKRAHFPFAVNYLGQYEMPVSFMDFEDLNALTSYVISQLKKVLEDIRTIYLRRRRTVTYQNGMMRDKAWSAIFTWKNVDIQDKIQKLFAGEKITLLADVKQSTQRYNAFKFKSVDLVFRSSTDDETTNDGLNEVLKAFELNLNHTGKSAIRCNDRFYEMTGDSVYISSSFSRDGSDKPMSRNMVFDMLRENRPSLSPYAEWEFQLQDINRDSGDFYELTRYAAIVDIELHGTGEFLMENDPNCKNEDLAKFYYQI